MPHRDFTSLSALGGVVVTHTYVSSPLIRILHDTIGVPIAAHYTRAPVIASSSATGNPPVIAWSKVTNSPSLVCAFAVRKWASPGLPKANRQRWHA